MNQESLAVAALLSWFGTSSTNVKASGLEGERAIDFSVQNLKPLEWYLSNIGCQVAEGKPNPLIRAIYI